MVPVLRRGVCRKRLFLVAALGTQGFRDLEFGGLSVLKNLRFWCLRSGFGDLRIPGGIVLLGFYQGFDGVGLGF